MYYFYITFADGYVKQVSRETNSGALAAWRLWMKALGDPQSEIIGLSEIDHD